MVRVTRARHALEGRSLELIGWMRRHGRLELLLVLADGSRVFVPAAWTDLDGGGAGPSAAGTLGSLEDLLAMRRVLDGVRRSGGVGESAVASDVVLVGRDDPVGEHHGDAVASGSGGVSGAGGGVVGAGRCGAAPAGADAAGGTDRACRRRGGDRR